MVRNEFHRQLEEIRGRTLQMGELALNMLLDSVAALERIDEKLAQRVQERKERLAELDDEIEQAALQVLTLQQPMAADLRFLGATLKLITYLNRVGRYGKDIAILVPDFKKQGHLGKLVDIPYMCRLVNQMQEAVLSAYKESSKLDIPAILEAEDQLDALRYSIYREGLSYMLEDPSTIARSTHYLMIARYLERCGDNVCKMAEKTVYMVSGKRVTIK